MPRALRLRGPRLGRRCSLRTLLAVSLVVLTVGGLLRTGASAVALFTGTVLVAAPIGVANVLIPGLIKRRFPQSVPRVSAFYSGALTFGAAGGPAVAVPLADATGSSWRIPLLLLVVPLSVATVVVVLLAFDRQPPRAPPRHRTRASARPGCGGACWPGR
ncbi:MFS transporter [Streptomyces mexicanus]